MNGIVVAQVLGLTIPPSEHYARTIGGRVDGVSPQFRALVVRLIDGEKAKPTGSRDIYPVYAGSANARLVVCDRSVEKCFVLDIQSRTRGDGLGPWHSTRANPPALLDDVLEDGVWQIFNCRIALQEWVLSAALLGEFP